MIKLFVIVFSITALTFPQNVDSSFNSLFQKANIIKFADHLFCERDYLRSANEYLRINETLRDEKINFKIALSFSIIGDYVSAKNIFGIITESSPYYKSSRLELMKINLIENKFSELKEIYQTGNNKIILQNELAANKLYNISYLKDYEEIPGLTDFVKPFDSTEQNEVVVLYQLKINPPNKNPISASLLSAIIPGAGKIYTGEVSDGIFAFLATGLLSFLAYDNFKAEHNFRGWLFAGLAAGFYAGNVYGSYASAQIYNARIKYEFNLRLDSFLKSKNYFMPEYDFCK
jgi:TM2 domain-containing membrane protein YozV